MWFSLPGSMVIPDTEPVPLLMIVPVATPEIAVLALLTYTALPLARPKYTLLLTFGET